MVVPSLILRLEPLARPDAGLEPARESDPVDADPSLADELAPEVTGGPSLADDRPADAAGQVRLATATPLSRWSAAVAAAQDGCFVVDTNGVVISTSMKAVDLFGVGDGAMVGRHLLDAVTLVDLDTGALQPAYSTRIPPLAVLDSRGLARSLIRVRHNDGTVLSLDASAAPIQDGDGNLLGAVAFVAPIAMR